MEFAITPEEAQSTAAIVGALLDDAGYRVSVEVPLSPAAPYTTTFLARAGGMPILVEVQHRPSYELGLREFVAWFEVNRSYGEIYVAMDHTAHITGGTMKQLQRDGVGLIVVAPDGSLGFVSKARNPALVVTIDPGITLGPATAEVKEVVERFNNGDRKAALRDLSDVVERETRTCAEKASRKGHVSRTVAQISRMDWSQMIDVLASPASYGVGHGVLVDPRLRADLHSFRGGRNLVDHPAPNRVADLRRQRQYPERMLMGSRLVGDLLTVKRRIR